MRLLNGPQGYGSVTVLLHWLTVGLLTLQLVLGYGMEAFSEALFEQDSSGGSGGDRVRAGDDQLVFLHAGLGVLILAVATIRLLWRLATPLPPWSERLGPVARTIESWTERVLYATLFVIPLSGLALLFLSGEERELEDRREWLPPLDVVSDDLMVGLHVGGHLTLYVALAVHVGLAIRRRTLSRML
ncbi:cytochrome b [Aeromicrobium alkaliterrae]|uniref:Cytochrome b561 bacterial/Ni-hydrogenase domain-containing protein n=1 Tax=Aeromicrobium alkaliterrae TaxID=302168 RepID=A0ABP4W8Y4_9ACTN